MKSLSLTTWSNGLAEDLRDRFQQRIYGAMPALPDLRRLASEALPASNLGGDAKVERWRLEIGIGGTSAEFDLLLVLPRTNPARAIVLCQLYQRPPSPLARIERAITHGQSQRRIRASDALLELILGEHIHVPPLEQIVQAGFGVCLFCPGDVVPDNKYAAPAMLDQLSGVAGTRTGALACWASLTSGVRRLLAEDVRLSATPIIAWGHSRHGKAALLAAAFDPAFAGVISHQSGRFGASLTRGATGESALRIATVYPHWFRAGFAQSIRDRESDVDQHHLLALVAPRPILLGNARRDFWADPGGAFKAAQSANAAFAHFGALGLTQTSMTHPDYAGGIVSFARNGGHGVNKADWGYFLNFMRAKFGSSPAS